MKSFVAKVKANLAGKSGKNSRAVRFLGLLMDLRGQVELLNQFPALMVPYHSIDS